ncbi:hypothetical protein D9758_010926 [Tetrapyrgos nigripes]|uniref:Uncharacterized protein n=1 Tax=Tetrapyrgos nigripes TaxID=182062 RepID=A0A8H5FTN0_9AGAR|nr:hypothetical protein D9758_010926 [Tetrapyrgos nigripes]
MPKARFEAKEVLGLCRMGLSKLKVALDQDMASYRASPVEPNPFKLLVWKDLENLPLPMIPNGVLSNTYHATSCPDDGPVTPQEQLLCSDCYISGHVRHNQQSRKDLWELVLHLEAEASARFDSDLAKADCSPSLSDLSSWKDISPVEFVVVDDETVLTERLLVDITGY